MNPDQPTAYDDLVAHAREVAMLNSVASLLAWDERTMMPVQAGPYRAEQMAYLSGAVHQLQTDPRVGEWLDALAESPLGQDAHRDTAAVIRWLDWQYRRQTRLPRSLVEALARQCVIGQQTWARARAADDFAALAPVLQKIVRLSRQKADALGYERSPYDALLEEYEPYERMDHVATVLRDLADELRPMVQAIARSDREAPVHLLEQAFPASVHESFGKEVAKRIGFDFQRGRLDATDHPFCTDVGPHDVRITTRYKQRHFTSSLFSILHEAGHGIYEQGLPAEAYGLPIGDAISLGIHESQSRMWENLVGRSWPFWEHFYPLAKKAYAPVLDDIPLDDFYFAVNDVRPSLIRVDADEVTYNLHILIRFELEIALVEDQLRVVDLPDAWNEQYRRSLGIDPPSSADGVLQDIHWSAGLIGYFPTYALGNLYAAQLFEAADRELGGLDESFRQGRFDSLRQWLQERLYRHGRRFTAAEIVQQTTGRSLSHEPLVRYLRQKFGRLFALSC